MPFGGFLHAFRVQVGSIWKSRRENKHILKGNLVRVSSRNHCAGWYFFKSFFNIWHYYIQISSRGMAGSINDTFIIIHMMSFLQFVTSHWSSNRTLFICLLRRSSLGLPNGLWLRPHIIVPTEDRVVKSQIENAIKIIKKIWAMLKRGF